MSVQFCRNKINRNKPYTFIISDILGVGTSLSSPRMTITLHPLCVKPDKGGICLQEGDKEITV